MDESVNNRETVRAESAGRHEFALEAGDILDQYRILRPLGAGGMGEVYLAENVHNHKRFALKVLPAALARDPQFVGRFKVESRVMMDLDHPGIVRVHHIGEARGLYYLTMDFVEGPDGAPFDLEDLLREQGGRIKDEKVVRELALQICDALDYAHHFRGEGIVHRDLKPANILLPGGQKTEDGRQITVRISDFGLAKVVGDAYLKSIIERSVSLSIGGEVSMGDEKTGDGRPKHQKTSTRSILGTYDYMSPEQKLGLPVDARSDIYALGMMLYKMLTGRKAEGAYRRPSQLGCGRAWDSVVERCIQQAPEDRYASVAVLQRDIEKTTRTTHRRAILSLIGIAAGVLLAAGFHFFLNTSRSNLKESVTQPEHGVSDVSLGSAADLKPRSVIASGIVYTQLPDGFVIVSGGLYISTEPSGATVSVDGYEITNSPATFRDMAAGSQIVTVKLADYESQTFDIDVPEDDFAKTNVVLVRKKGLIEVTSRPAGAQVMQGSRVLGETPMSARLEVGPQILTIRKYGFRDADVRADVTADLKTIVSEVTLTSELGAIRITARPASGEGKYFDILDNRIELGSADRKIENSSFPCVVTGLAVGAIQVAVAVDGYKTATNMVTVAGGRTTDTEFVLARLGPVDGADWSVPGSTNLTNAQEMAYQAQTNGTNPSLASSVQLVADGKLLLRQNKLAEAEKMFQSVLGQSPNMLDARIGLAACRYNAGDLDQAQRLVGDVLAVEAKNAQALGLMGIIAWREGRYRDAVEILSEAVRADPTDAQLHSYLGVAFQARKRYAEATQELRTAVTLDPNNAEAQYNLSVVLATARSPLLQEAKAHYDLALQLGYPRDDAMDKLLSRIPQAH
ncbi:MAG: PEGA domain-containing protein [bacterium]